MSISVAPLGSFGSKLSLNAAELPKLDVHLPTTDGRETVMTRHTQPENDLQLLLDQLKLTLPEQGPPKIQSLK